MIDYINSVIDKIKSIEDITQKIEFINSIKEAIHNESPFKNEPVDFVKWVKNEEVIANDYNPNSVAPPEMELLKHSILCDGFTQPIVSMPNKTRYEVVDGFHRHRVGKEDSVINNNIYGYLPIVQIREEQFDKTKRMASTIRHNRARGKHKVEAMSDIVVELKRRNWSNEKISRELGMDEDEILRLCQITGLSELFSDTEFSKSWDVEGDITESDFVELSDDVDSYGDEVEEFRTVNTSDESRIFHQYKNWECYKAGFYSTIAPNNMTKDQCELAYKNFLSNNELFRTSLAMVISEWKNSCEHCLTNSAMNRIAWLGQAAMCYATGISSNFRSGFHLLTNEQQEAANNIALKYLNEWLAKNNREKVTLSEALSDGRQSDIY